MANRRMLSKSISISEQVNELSDFAALLFTWMIPHADDFGILPGSLKKVKALVMPMRKQTPKDIEKALRELVSGDLVWWYEVDGDKYIQFRKWDKHQEGLHKRTKPKFPEFPGDSGKVPEIPEDSRLIEPNRTELYIYSVFDHWNSKGIILHREMSKKLQGHINARLENYSVEEIMAAIDNYDTVLKGEEYFFSYKWSLEEFLTRGNGLIKFLPESDPLTNYLKNKDSPAPPPSAVRPPTNQIQLDPRMQAKYAAPFRKAAAVNDTT
ncbi:MAG: hypothetical protein M0P69_08695 [Bacteroidales bacterium]|nr:hypothetical protein [Bacteroidales bacterium]